MESTNELNQNIHNMDKEEISFDDQTLRFGLSFVIKHQTGFRETLDNIALGFSSYLSRLGYISFGADSRGDARYSVTNEGLAQMKVLYLAMLSNTISL